MIENLNLMKDDGSTITPSIVSVFNATEIQKEFIITTENNIDPNGLVILSVSEITDNKLVKVSSEEDWTVIKQIMRSIISSSAGSFKYLAPLKNINASIDFARNISVQTIAKDQLVQDYQKNKPSEGLAPVAEEQQVNNIDNPALGGQLTPLNSNEVAPGIVEMPTPVDLITPAEPTIVPLPEEPVQMDIPVVEQPTQIEVPVEQPFPVEAPIIEMNPAPVVDTPMTPAPPVVAPTVETPPVTNTPTGINVDVDKIIEDAKAVFIESAKNLAEVIVAEAYQSIKAKEAELANREIIVSQREMAVNQQTMINNSQYNG